MLVARSRRWHMFSSEAPVDLNMDVGSLVAFDVISGRHTRESRSTCNLTSEAALRPPCDC